jgi:hypothetical protein
VSSNMYMLIPSPSPQAQKQHEPHRHVCLDQISICWKCCHCCQESLKLSTNLLITDTEGELKTYSAH